MKSFGWFIICFFTLAATAQDCLVVSGIGTNLFVTKIMTGPQSLSSVSDQYNIPLSVLAKFNSLRIKKRGRNKNPAYQG